MVNEQVKALGPLMSRLRSTGVYFTTPPPAPALPALPGQLVETVTADGQAMIGEFSGTGPASGERYAMLVNLNLQRSVKFTLRFRGGAVENVRLVSPVDGSLAPLGEADDTLWLAAGQGALLRVR
jgi:hypothetical protein